MLKLGPNEKARVPKKRMLLYEAQAAIIKGAITEAFHADEDKNSQLADEIRRVAAMIAKQWKICDVYGLPDTWKKGRK
jgi:hypothetical protein